MIRLAAILILTLSLSGTGILPVRLARHEIARPAKEHGQDAHATLAAAAVTFVPVDVIIDPQGKPLACYQIEIAATTGNAKLTGIEGGEEANFNQAPYYDPRALQNGERVIIGAYSLASNLPTAKTRVATLMFQVTGPVEPQYHAILQVAASSDEKRIPATVSLVAHPAPRRAGIATADFTGGVE